MKKLLLLALGLSITCLASAQSGLKVGDRAPEFKGTDQHGKRISLAQALEKGPVALIFYRGQWCPYCQRALSQLQDSLQLLTEKGVTVIAVSPEVAKNVAKTVEKSKASFHIISDNKLAIMKAYDVAFDVDEETQKKYKGYGIDFAEANGDNGASLPVPATYLIGTDGTVKYAFFDKDYKHRAGVAAILANLE